MLRLLGSISLILLISCNEKRKFPVNSVKEIYFDTSLNNALLNYQKLFPIPDTSVDKDVKYIYVALFSKIQQDTIVQIIRSGQGYKTIEDEIAYGIYENDSLAPTVIIDKKYFYSKELVKNVITDSQSLLSFRTIISKDYPENFPPLFTYKVKRNMLLLESVDTSWLKWD